jgi:hypothetical protein
MNFEVCILKYESCICISFPHWNLKYEKLKRIKTEKRLYNQCPDLHKSTKKGKNSRNEIHKSIKNGKKFRKLVYLC